MSVNVWLRAFALLGLGLVACGAEPPPAFEEVRLEAGGWEEPFARDPEARCIVGGALQRPLWVITDPQVLIYEPGREPQELAAELRYVSRSGLDVGPEYVAVVATDAGVEQLSLFERETGALVWQRSYSGAQLSFPRVDASGRVTAAYSESSGGVQVVDGGLWSHADRDFELDGFFPRGTIDKWGFIPGWFRVSEADHAGAWPAPRWGWLEPYFGFELILDGPSEASEVLAADVVFDEGEIEYLDLDHADGPRLVRAAPSGGKWIALPPDATDFVRLPAAPGYRLVELASPGGVELVRVVTSDGAQLRLDPPAPPPGMSVFGCASPGAGVDAFGRVLGFVRDAHQVWLGAWEPSDASWTLLGVPMAGVSELEIVEVLGPWVHVRAETDADCSAPDWTPGAEPGASWGDSEQIIHVGTGASVDVGPQLQLDPHQVCASWRVDGGTVIFDLQDKDSRVLPGAHSGWID